MSVPIRRFGAEALEFASRLAWVVFLVSLPVTSFPYFPDLPGLGEIVVRPLAMYPLAVLVLADLRDLVPVAHGRRAVSRAWMPLLAFLLLALAITLFHLTSPPVPFRGQVPWLRGARALCTLSLGATYFLVVAKRTAHKGSTASTLGWLYLGLAAALAWSGLQASALLLDWPDYFALNRWHRLFSIRDMHTLRVTGLAYEPSWYADQLVALYLPLLWGSLLAGYRVFSGRRLAPYFEPLLLAAGMVVLVLTYSRGGLVTFAVAFGLVFVLWLGLRRNRALDWLLGRGDLRPGRRPAWLWLSLRWLVPALALIGFAVVFVQLARQNYYLQLLWARRDRLTDLPRYIISIGGGPRLALAQAGWEVFEDHPWLGVGLGQSGYYLLDHLPSWARDRRSEIVLMLAPFSHTFPNPKNLWVRLLAETGVVGFSTFLAFLAVLGGHVVELWRRRSPQARAIGLAGAMAMAAACLEGFSLDTFALPTMWIALGLVVGTHAALVGGEGGAR